MARNILIVGRGAAGLALSQDIVRRADGSVIGYLDDAAVGDDVLGRLADVNEVIEDHRVDLVYFAIPSADSTTVRDFVSSIARRNVDIAIIPRTYEILSKEGVDIDDLTDVDVLDLVGRRPVKHDFVESLQFLRDKRVLITGAAGSIGSRLIRQVVAMGATAVVGVDWWENGVFELEQATVRTPGLGFVIADVKNKGRMEEIFARHRPDVVFHAAAYKHVPLMQENPVEAITNNVGGSLAMMELALAAGCSHFVLVSTDKAVNPVNVMGATKRIAERALQSFAASESTTRFNAVRFGNVIQSNGSVMQTFRRQILAGKNLTVTHRDVTRFFMTLDEATQLIIQSAFVGGPGDIFVLDMGEPVRIYDLARSLIAAVAPGLGIDIVGLRPGEKMFEELTYEPEKVVRTANEKIFIAQENSMRSPGSVLDEIRALAYTANSGSMKDAQGIDALVGLGFAVAGVEATVSSQR